MHTISENLLVQNFNDFHLLRVEDINCTFADIPMKTHYYFYTFNKKGILRAYIALFLFTYFLKQKKSGEHIQTKIWYYM